MIKIPSGCRLIISYEKEKLSAGYDGIYMTPNKPIDLIGLEERLTQYSSIEKELERGDKYIQITYNKKHNNYRLSLLHKQSMTDETDLNTDFYTVSLTSNTIESGIDRLDNKLLQKNTNLVKKIKSKKEKNYEKSRFNITNYGGWYGKSFWRIKTN